MSHETAGERGPALEPGQSFGGAVLIRKLGEGGMGSVWLARQGEMPVAIKFLLALGAVERERFRREALALASVGAHHHIAGIRTVSPLDAPFPWLVCDFVEGGSLADQLESGQGPDLRGSLRLVATLARTLERVHAAGLTHRDIKPDNILIRELDAEPVLTDFGIARQQSLKTLTQTGEMVGTPHWMAPEQIDATLGQVGPATDIWALGVLLYRLTTDELPFRRPTVLGLMAMIMSGEPTTPSELRRDLPVELDRVIQRCLAKDPDARYRSAAELAEVCRELAERDELTAPRRRRLMPAVAAILVFLALLGVAVQQLDQAARRRAREAAALTRLREMPLEELELEGLAEPILVTLLERRSVVDATRVQRGLEALALVARVHRDGAGPVTAGELRSRRDGLNVLAALADPRVEPPESLRTPLYEAVSLARTEPESALNHVRRLGRESDPRLADFLSGVLELRTRRLRDGIAHLEALEFPPAIRDRIQSLLGETRRRVVAALILEARVTPGEVIEAATWTHGKPPPSEPDEALQARLDAALWSVPEPTDERLLRAWKLAADCAGPLGLRLITGPPALHRRLLAAARRDKDEPAALQQALLLRRIDESFRLPDELRLSSIGGRVEIELLRARAANDGGRSLARRMAEIAELQSAAARAGVFVLISRDQQFAIPRGDAPGRRRDGRLPDITDRFWDLFKRPFDEFGEPGAGDVERAQAVRAAVQRLSCPLLAEPLRRALEEQAMRLIVDRLFGESQVVKPADRLPMARLGLELADKLRGGPLSAPGHYGRGRALLLSITCGALPQGPTRDGAERELVAAWTEAEQLTMRRYAASEGRVVLKDDSEVAWQALDTSTFATLMAYFAARKTQLLEDLGRTLEARDAISKYLFDYTRVYINWLLLVVRILVNSGDVERARDLLRSWQDSVDEQVVQARALVKNGR